MRLWLEKGVIHVRRRTCFNARSANTLPLPPHHSSLCFERDLLHLRPQSPPRFSRSQPPAVTQLFVSERRVAFLGLLPPPPSIELSASRLPSPAGLISYACLGFFLALALSSIIDHQKSSHSLLHPYRYHRPPPLFTHTPGMSPSTFHPPTHHERPARSWSFWFTFLVLVGPVWTIIPAAWVWVGWEILDVARSNNTGAHSRSWPWLRVVGLIWASLEVSRYCSF